VYKDLLRRIANSNWVSGAGVIFKDAGSVRGLNTAATIWCSAAIGAISGYPVTGTAHSCRITGR
jgi:uncharacterized membrane protein YhiD involved in acid resistance